MIRHGKSAAQHQVKILPDPHIRDMRRLFVKPQRNCAVRRLTVKDLHVPGRVLSGFCSLDCCSILRSLDCAFTLFAARKHSYNQHCRSHDSSGSFERLFVCFKFK